VTTIAAGARRRPTFAWVGVVPFFVISTAFLLAPVAFLVVGSFQDTKGAWTLKNYLDLGTLTIPTAFRNSIEISAVTAIMGGFFGFLLAWAVIMGRLPGWIRSAVMTFSGVASNFAGIPLALAFIFTIGAQGLITKFLLERFGITMRTDLGFNLYSKLGLEIVYLYFQFPLMVLIIAPAIDGLRREWREAAANLGATTSQYWRQVAFPILTPSILGTVILLFGNAFGAQATAYQLTGGQLELATLAIGRQISGDVFHNQNLAYAMSMGMIVIMSVSIGIYTFFQRRSERWLRS